MNNKRYTTWFLIAVLADLLLLLPSRGFAQGEPAVLKGYSAEINSVAFWPDGKTFASGSSDKTIRLWDPGISKPLSQALLPLKDQQRQTFFDLNDQQHRTILTLNDKDMHMVFALLGDTPGSNGIAFNPKSKVSPELDQSTGDVSLQLKVKKSDYNTDEIGYAKRSTELFVEASSRSKTTRLTCCLPT